jgi:hypothetical protein
MENSSLIKLSAGSHGSIHVQPRRMEHLVMVTPAAFRALCSAQALLPPEIQLVLTRGYEPATFVLRLSRRIGWLLFTLLYPLRAKEAGEIFHHNGHASDGDHIDVSIRLNKQLLHLLPLSVFTPLSLIKKIEFRHAILLARVTGALRSEGFVVHQNRVEALQIHCDLAR